MSDDSKPVARSLNVLPNSGKVDQLRKEFAAVPRDAAPVARTIDSNKSAEQLEVEQRVIDALRTVYDPELPVNLYDLGLIYTLDFSPSDSSIKVTMTLTAPGCPVAGTLPGEVKRKIETVDGVKRADVELVWEPPWTKDRMTEAALLDLGLL